MSKVKWFAIAFFTVILLYALLWLIITFSIAQHYTNEFAGKANAVTGFNEEKYQIAFDKATPYGFPFKFGIKLYNFSEETSNSQVTHLSPVCVGYDLLLQKFYMSYKGKSISRPKPISTGFGTEISGEFSYSLVYYLKPKIVSIITHPDRNFFELINFSQSIEFVANDIKAYDLIDKSLLLDAKHLMGKLNITKKPYYKNIDELKANPPGSYHLTSSAQINNVVKGRRIASGSLIYGILPSHVFKYELDLNILTNAKNFKLVEFIKNMKLTSNKMIFSDSSEDWSGNLRYNSVSKDGKIDVSIQYGSLSKLKPNFLERQLEICKSIALDLINTDGPITFLKPALNSFLENPKKYLPNKHDIKKVETELDFRLHGEDSNFQLDINNLSFFIDDVGFRIKNTSTVDNLLTWNTSGALILNNYKNSVDFITDYTNQIIDPKDDIKVQDLKKDARKTFLRIISNHPESESNDLALDYEFSSSLANGKIGTSSMSDVLALYYSTLYRKAIALAKLEPDFNKALQELAPDLLSRPELINTLMQDK